MTDAARQPDPLAAAARLPKGAAVLLRDYDAADREARATALAALCRRRGLTLIVATDARLAAKAARAGLAMGLHLPAWDVPGARRRIAFAKRRGWLVTAAAHDAAEIAAAARAGADAVVLAPAFATASHPGRRPLGVVRFAALARQAGRAGRGGLAVYAMGGIGAATAPRLLGTGAAGLAGIGGIV